MLDLDTVPGRRAEERLRTEAIGWLTTVNPTGQPQSSAVWFEWVPGDGAADEAFELVLRSRPGAPRVRNLAANPRVAFNLNSDADGGDVVTLEGEARIAGAAFTAEEAARYRAKYESAVPELGWTWAQFLEIYSTVIRIRITRVRLL